MKKLTLAVLALVAAACNKGPLNGDAFIAYYRTDASNLTSTQPSLVTAANGDGKSFYVAVKANQLTQRWFMSAYLAQVYPGEVNEGAATPLGTRVVSFQIQNGKLFMFDSSNTKNTSDMFAPELIVDAYPIVTDATFAKLPNAADYILIDPSQSLAQWSLFNDQDFASGGTQFNMTVSFLQNFRALTDGATFEQVFTGYSTYSDPNAQGQGQDNTLQASGTLGISLRKYAEGAGFTSKELPNADPGANQEYFWRSPISIVPDTDTTHQTALRWNIHKGEKKTIDWILSANVAQIAADPRFVAAGVDVLGALEKGVLNWNSVFGYKALTVRVAQPGESFDQDDKNFVILDESPAIGFAFATERSNPITGEIRGASVYYSSLWFEDAYNTFFPAQTTAARATTAPVKAPRLSWNPMGSPDLCHLLAPRFRPTAKAAAATTPAQTMTPKEQFENLITHILLHEIGHTLGLRHNFEGSLLPVSSSVMDYIFDQDAVNLSHPQSYDIAAIRYLYDLSADLPTQPFCSDEFTGQLPDCLPYDTGAKPLTDYFLPLYLGNFGFYAQHPDAFQEPSIYVDSPLNESLKYVREPADAASQVTAWNAIIAPIHLPLSAANAADPKYVAAADEEFRVLINRLWLDPANLRDDSTWTGGDPVASNDPPVIGDFYVDALGQLSSTLINDTHVRSYATRRATVDVLKHLQDVKALEILNQARNSIASALPNLAGDEQANTQDLLNRVTAAANSYFN